MDEFLNVLDKRNTIRILDGVCDQMKTIKDEYVKNGSLIKLTIRETANGNEVFTKTMTTYGGDKKIKAVKKELSFDGLKYVLRNGYFKYEIPCIGLSNYKQENSIVLSTIQAMFSLTDFNRILFMEKINLQKPLPTDTLLYQYLKLLSLVKGGNKFDKKINQFLDDKQNEEEERFRERLDCSTLFQGIIKSIVEAMRFPQPRIDTIEHTVSRFLERMEEDLNQIGWFNVVSELFSIRATDGQPGNRENRYLHNVIVDNNNKDHSLTRIAGEQGLFGKDVVKKSIFVVQIVKKSQDLDPKDPIDELQTTEVNDGSQQSVEYKLRSANGFDSVTQVVDNEVIAGHVSAYRKIGDQWVKITDHKIQSSDTKEVTEKARVLFYEN